MLPRARDAEHAPSTPGALGPLVRFGADATTDARRDAGLTMTLAAQALAASLA
ncbi:MAG TPA: hypothetical protein VFB41_05980 [Solirubrobacteraceae bacterium]|nr:hypothetical protein [Solirubrobacteraceae bacterium]